MAEYIFSNILAPSVLISIFFGFIFWLAPKWLTTRLTKSIQHEYDGRLEELKADLKAKEAQLNMLTSGALTAVTSRQSLLFEKRIQAIEILWKDIINLGPQKNISSQMAVLKFDQMADAAVDDGKVREFASLLATGIDLKVGNQTEALTIRPFVSPMLWAFYSAYVAIVSHAVARLLILQHGVDKKLIDDKNVTELVKAALPDFTNYIDEHGPDAFHYLLDALEKKILEEISNMLSGKDNDEAALVQAANIVTIAEEVILTSDTAKAGEK